jgi:ABC-2 type transport system ATP-binding protein
MQVDSEVAVARACGVRKSFPGSPSPALDHVDLEVLTGRMTGLVGPDGAGKTTLVRILAGLVVPDAGEVTLLGKPAASTDRTQIGYMPQRFGLYEELSVVENLTLYARLRGLADADRARRFDELLAFTDLKRFQDRPAGKLSGGMKQKLGLACALVRQPKLLLLDEPGVGVDPVSRRELWHMVKGLLGEGVGVLWTTAYLDEAERCDVVHLMHEGKLLHAGAPAELTRRVAGRVFRIGVAADQRRKALRQLLQAEPVADALIQGDSVRVLMHEHSSLEKDLAQWKQDAVAIKPRFEDAFVDVLGGGPRGSSALAEGYRTIPSTSEPLIVANGLTRRFGEFTAAQDIRFTVPQGQIMGLLGPNGAGKSTTFKMLCGLLTPSSGTGSVAGFDLRTARADARQSLGYMAQKFSLYGDLSVAQNLEFFAGAYGLERQGQRDAIERMTEVFHLKSLLKVNSGTLPLGYKQRLALACAVLHQPPVLFLDEPTSGVDPIVRREFWAHINGLVEKGVTVLVTTHFMEEAEYCDRIALIYRGQEIAIGSPDELKHRVRGSGGAPTEPTLEDAFIALLEEFDRQQVQAAA